MANRIVGLDIGTFAIKAVAIEQQRTVEVVAYREIPIEELQEESRSGGGVDGTVDDGMAGGQTDPDTEPGEMFPDPGQQPQPEDQQTPPVGEEQAGGDWTDEGIDPDDDGPSQWGESQPEADEAQEEDDEPLGPDAPRWAAALRRLIREGFFEDVNRVITSFPDDEAAVLHLEVPFGRPDEVEEVLPHLLMDKLPMSFDDIIHDFVVVPGSGDNDWEALVGFVRREQMSKLLGDFKDLGMDPAVVGVAELMLRYAGEQVIEPEVDSYGIIDIGHRYSRLLIMSEGKPVVAHTTRRAGAAITEAIAQNFQVDPSEARRLKHEEGIVGPAARAGDRQVRKLSGTVEEALRPVVRDMRRSFQSAYAKYGVAVDEIYICGGTSRLHGIDEYLQGEFDVPVSRLEMDRGISWRVGADSRQRQPEAVLALAHALQRPLDGDNETVVDLRQEEFVYRGKSSYLRQQLVRLGAVAAVLAVMLAGVLVMQQYDRRAQLQSMQQAVAEQTQELFGESVTDPADVQARLRGEGMADRGFIPQMSAYELKVRIIEQIDEGVPLELDRMEVDIDRSLVQMMAKTDSPQSVDRIAGDIENLECLRDVSKERVNVEGDDEVQFELQITSGCS